MKDPQKICPDCESADFESPALESMDVEAKLDSQIIQPRRNFLKTATVATLASSCLPLWATAKDTEKATSETLLKKLYDSLSEKQKSGICFDWDYQDPQRGLLRTRVSNNWHIVKQTIGSDYYTKDQQEIIRAMFEGLYSPEWLPKIEKQLKDDAGGYGVSQNIAIFGTPGSENFELVMTGRHLTIRCDGNTTDHVALGGPIFYGHAAEGFNEKPDHPGNVFWPIALEANKVFEILDGKQRKKALVPRRPAESAVSFQGKDGKFPGIPITELTDDQKGQVQKTLAKILEPYRNIDQKEVRDCLEKQGGLDACSLAFYQDGDLGDDSVWDNWRLEGPSFVYYFRGAPHVHVWVNIASDPSVKLNA